MLRLGFATRLSQELSPSLEDPSTRIDAVGRQLQRPRPHRRAACIEVAKACEHTCCCSGPPLSDSRDADRQRFATAIADDHVEKLIR